MRIEVVGERVVLRTMTREEYHQIRMAYVPDPMMDPGPYTYNALKTDEAYDRIMGQADWYPRVGIFTKAGQAIGELSFKRIDREKSRCELGIVLSQDAYKGQGLGGEAFALATDYALSELGLEYVYADTMGSNIRMQRVMERIGFTCFLRIEKAYDMVDRWEDRLDYRITRAQRQAVLAGQPG